MEDKLVFPTCKCLACLMLIKDALQDERDKLSNSFKCPASAVAKSKVIVRTKKYTP